MQASRQVFLDFDQCTLNRTLEPLNARRTVAFHHYSLQPEKARTIVPSRRQVRL